MLVKTPVSIKTFEEDVNEKSAESKLRFLSIVVGAAATTLSPPQPTRPDYRPEGREMRKSPQTSGRGAQAAISRLI